LWIENDGSSGHTIVNLNRHSSGSAAKCGLYATAERGLHQTHIDGHKKMCRRISSVPGNCLMQSKELTLVQLGMQVRPGQTHGNNRIKQHKKDRRISQNQPEGIAGREAECVTYTRIPQKDQAGMDKKSVRIPHENRRGEIEQEKPVE